MPSEVLPIQNINSSYVGFSFGSGNYVTAMGTTPAADMNFIAGKGNYIISGENCRLFGFGNSACSANFNFIVGNSNFTQRPELVGTLNPSDISQIFVIGCSNHLSGGKSNYTTPEWQEGDLSGYRTDNCTNAYVLGHGNNVSGNLSNEYIFGHSNNIYAGTYTVKGPNGYWEYINAGSDNWILGMSISISGNKNHAFGGNQNITGSYNTTFADHAGVSLTGSGNFIKALGTWSNRVSVSGNFNTAFLAKEEQEGLPYTAISGHHNFIAGKEITISGYHKTAIGLGLAWNGNGTPPATIVGCYNATTAVGVGSPEIFIVGNGYNTESRSDAFKIKHDGTTSAADFIASGGQKLSETIPVVLVATVAEATGHGNDGKLYIVTGAN